MRHLPYTQLISRKSVCRKLTDDSGYTLLESLLHLSAFLLLAHLSVIILLIVGKTVSLSTDTEEIEWELFSSELLSSLLQSESLTIQNGSRGIQLEQNGEWVEIEYYTGMIRRQKDGKGHEPLLLSVEHAEFLLDGHVLLLTVHFKSGKIKERSYVLPS